MTASGHRAVLGGPSDAGEEGKHATAVLLPWTRNPRDVLAGLKTLNYAFSSLGLREARVRGTDEGLWRNTRGFLVVGSASNLFVVRGGRIFTPALGEGLLPGVTRRFAIEAASRLGYPLHQGKVRVQRLARADEAFLTSSLKGVRPLVRFEGEPIGTGEPGPVTLEIAREVASIRRERAAVERSRG